MDIAVACSTVDSVCSQLACMIAHLKEIAPDFYDSPETRSSAVLDKAHQTAIHEFLSAHPVLSEPGAMLREGFPDTMEADICGWAHYNDPVPFFYLLLEIEGRLDIEDLLRLVGEDPFTSLNSNRETMGIYVLPRVRSIHDPFPRPDEDEEEGASHPKHWAGDWNAGINQDLKNIFYVESGDLVVRGNAYNIRNVVLTPVLDGRDDFLIALSPVVCDAKLDEHYGEEKSGGITLRQFSVQGITNAERVHSRIRASFLEACRACADMVVFPEVLGDKDLLEPEDIYSGMIDSIIEEAERQNCPAPYLTLMPTWWHDECNELYVISGKNERLCIQQKQTPFIKEKDGAEYSEALGNTRREVQVLHMDGLGRITFPICKDLLVQDYGDLLIKTLHSTFAICPSFSPRKTQFDLNSLKGRQYGCYIIWLNTCSAVEGEGPPDHVGWIACPFPEETEQRLCPDCNGNCGADADVCMFLVRISLDRERPEVKIEDHIHTCNP